jgi:HlyD family secretion protein
VVTDLNSLRIDRSLKSTPARKSGRAVRWIVLAAVVLIGGSAAVYFLQPAPPIDVQVARAVPVQVNASGAGSEDTVVLNATGYIVAAHKIELAPKVSGRVEWVGVDMADKVKKGQVLVRLEQEEFAAAVKQQQGQVDAAKAKLLELQNGSRPDEIALAQADVDQAVANMKDAKATLDRVQAVTDAKAISRQQLDDDIAAYESAKAKVASLQANYNLVREGQRQEEIEIQKANVLQYEGYLDLAKINLENTIIRAPIDGTILDRNIELGEFVTTLFVGEGGAKGYVVSLADLHDLRVELDISQNDFNKIAPQQRCYVTTDAYPDRKYPGIVDQISPEANRAKATVLVKVKILNPDDLLRPDMNATVGFYRAGATTEPTAAPSPHAVSIPNSAVHDGNVFVVVDGKAVQRAVELGPRSGDAVQITSGLSVGDAVIVNPPTTVHSGLAVRAQGETPAP